MSSALLPTYNRTQLTFVSGQGPWLTEADGRKFLDFTSGIAVNALGHAHPELAQTLCEQASKLWHVSNLYRVSQQEHLAQRLVDLTFADKVFFTNSGTESAELAIKMARKFHFERGAAERVEIIAFAGAFHGRSTGAIAAAGSEKMVKGFGPLMPHFRHIAWGDHDAIKAAITHETCAVIIEPIQGEGGIRKLPDACLKGLRAACDATGTLLILDEVQCGMGRTGRLFAHEWAGVSPDIMMVAKGIGGGFPLGAVLATDHAASGMTAGSHGSTYGGNPLGCAVGSKLLDIVANPDFLHQVTKTGRFLSNGLQKLVATYPDLFEEARGEGLLLGLKCTIPNTEMVTACHKALLLVAPAADNVIRLLPPLNLTQEEAEEALTRLNQAAKNLLRPSE